MKHFEYSLFCKQIVYYGLCNKILSNFTDRRFVNRPYCELTKYHLSEVIEQVYY